MWRFFEKLFHVLFKKQGDTNIISNSPNWRVGVSVAADWSWGVSMAVGLSIMKMKGVCPFLIWMIGNILAMPLVGFVRRFLPDSRSWSESWLMLALFMVVEYFAITINLQAILTGLGGGTDVISYVILPRNIAVWAVVAYGLFVWWYVNRGGLRILMITDLGFFIVQIIAAIFISGASYVIAGGSINSQLHWTMPGGMSWAPYAFLGIITGALSAGHQWQKYDAKESSIFQISMWGGLFFGIYMSFVFVAGLYFSKSLLLGVSFLVIMVALATSTIDSAISGVGYVLSKIGIKNQLVRSVIPIVIILSWSFANGKSMADMWLYMANFRWPIIIYFIILTAIATVVKSPKIKGIFRRLYLMR